MLKFPPTIHYQSHGFVLYLCMWTLGIFLIAIKEHFHLTALVLFRKRRTTLYTTGASLLIKKDIMKQDTKGCFLDANVKIIPTTGGIVEEDMLTVNTGVSLGGSLSYSSPLEFSG